MEYLPLRSNEHAQNFRTTTRRLLVTFRVIAIEPPRAAHSEYWPFLEQAFSRQLHRMQLAPSIPQ